MAELHENIHYGDGCVYGCFISGSSRDATIEEKVIHTLYHEKNKLECECINKGVLSDLYSLIHKVYESCLTRNKYDSSMIDDEFYEIVKIWDEQ